MHAWPTKGSPQRQSSCLCRQEFLPGGHFAAPTTDKRPSRWRPEVQQPGNAQPPAPEAAVAVRDAGPSSREERREASDAVASSLQLPGTQGHARPQVGTRRLDWPDSEPAQAVPIPAAEAVGAREDDQTPMQKAAEPEEAEDEAELVSLSSRSVVQRGRAAAVPQVLDSDDLDAAPSAAGCSPGIRSRRA